jgi:catechol 2,3-dioxygenase-like lactoylglutathione lyase family enzyme
VPLQNLNHLLVLARDLDETRDFYVNVLGLTEGPRPPFRFRGYWLYLGDRAVVHLAEQGGERTSERDGERDGAGTGPIDHVAFEATGLADMVASLERHAIALRHRKVPGQALHQVFIQDPNGVTIELNYPAAEGAGFDA